jgi:hypothetical protein
MKSDTKNLYKKTTEIHPSNEKNLHLLCTLSLIYFIFNLLNYSNYLI